MSRTKLFARPIYWLLILALVLSLAVVAVPMGSRVNADPSEVWVCPTGDCGHPGAQYDNIHDGIDAVAQPGTVHVAAGTYTESNINLKNNVQVLGAGAAVTIIDGGGTDSVVKATGGVGASTKLDGFTVTNGTASSGGGIYLDSSSPVISNCVFDGNSAPGEFGAKGGGMYNSNSSSPTVTNCIFDGNSAFDGGGMYNDYSSPTVANCVFDGNSGHRGSGMWNLYSSPAVTNCTFDGNSAFDGGGMYNDHSSPTVTDCTFEGNSGYIGGGMYNNYSSSPNVTNCTFKGNSALWDGGGMYNLWYSSPNVTNCIFDGNSATGTWFGRGGGICNDSSWPTLTNCIFHDNSATGKEGKGGGMYNDNYYGYGSWPTLTNCVFHGNSATGNDGKGGGMYNINSSPTVTNCVFHDNSATYNGGGMYNSNGCSPDLTNCIVTSNTAGSSYSGGGIYWGDCLLADPYYNDFWDNSPDDYGTCSPGPHDISLDPMFANPSAQDFHLMPGSPCIDAGTNDGAPSGDMDGNPRTIDGDGDGNAITDMGAYEYVPASVEFSATPTMGPTPLEVRFSDETPGDFDSWSWDFGDGSTSSEQQNPAHIYTLPGPFTVSLIVSGPSGGGIETKVDYIHPYTQGVGGEAYPVNRLAILAPWFGLAALLLGGTGWLALRRRRA